MRRLLVEHEQEIIFEVIVPRRLPNPVANRAQHPHEGEIARKPDQKMLDIPYFQRLKLFEEQAQNGNDDEFRMFQNIMHVPEKADPLVLHVQNDHRDQSAHDVHDDGEMEQFLALQNQKNEEQIGTDIAKLQREFLHFELPARSKYLIELKEQTDRHGDQQHSLHFARLVPEYEIKKNNLRRHKHKDEKMGEGEPLEDQVRIPDVILRRVRGDRQRKNPQRYERERQDFLFCEFEVLEIFQ